MRYFPFFFFILAFFLGVLTHLEQAFGSPYGYTRDVRAERESQYQEIIIMPFQTTGSVDLKSKVFNSELSKEFKTKYIQQFGAVDTDSFVYRDSKYAELADDNRKGIVAEKNSIEARRSFAEFMVKRLTESHVDHFIKEDPQMRPIYEAKEKISNVKVEINKETKLDIQYSLSGNTLDLNFINPHIDSRLISYMDPSAFGPASTIENKIWLGKQINRLSRVNLYAAEIDGIVTGEYVRSFKGNITGSLASSTWFKTTGTTPRETKTTVSMSTSF